jgi:flagellar hook-associated protein 3 FlgL
MRITNRTMNNNLLRNLNRSMGRLDKINNQLASKRQISVPSDDPVKAGVILRLRTSVRETEQYIRNTDSAISWLDATDVVLSDVINVIHRAKELATTGASTHLDETSKKALADEVAQLHDSLLQLANSTHGGRYLFGGQKTNEPPFEAVPGQGKISTVNFKGDYGDIEYEIGVGVTMAVNLKMIEDSDGKTVPFGQLFDVLGQLYDELSGTGEPDEDSSVLGSLDEALDNVLQLVSEVGGKQNRVELASERLKDLRLNVIQLMSEAEDVDYAETIMHLKMEEFAYRTALSVGARIIQPSLVDFLR